MTRPRADVTEAELAVLKELWELGPSTIRELADRLYPGGATAHYATVQKLLERLTGKGCVKRRGRGRADLSRDAGVLSEARELRGSRGLRR